MQIDEAKSVKIYVVYEEDRGMGISIVSAHYSEAAAKKVAHESGHYYVMETYLS